MHEMSICESLVSIIEDQAVAQSFSRVNMVRLEVGALAGVEIEALRFSFEVVTRNGIADGAKLDVIKLPVTGWCMPCANAVVVKERYDACPDCGSYQIQITGGEELRIKEMEVD